MANIIGKINDVKRNDDVDQDNEILLNDYHHQYHYQHAFEIFHHLGVEML